jgi:hypothetical protein
MEVDDPIDEFISPNKKRKVGLDQASEEQSFAMPPMPGDDGVAVPVVPKLRVKDLMDGVIETAPVPPPQRIIVSLGYDEVSNPVDHRPVREFDL